VAYTIELRSPAQRVPTLPPWAVMVMVGCVVEVVAGGPLVGATVVDEVDVVDEVAGAGVVSEVVVVGSVVDEVTAAVTVDVVVVAPGPAPADCALDGAGGTDVVEAATAPATTNAPASRALPAGVAAVVAAGPGGPDCPGGTGGAGLVLGGSWPDRTITDDDAPDGAGGRAAAAGPSTLRTAERTAAPTARTPATVATTHSTAGRARRTTTPFPPRDDRTPSVGTCPAWRW
jgi:hypothetical protein